MYINNLVDKITKLDIFFVKLIQWIIVESHYTDLDEFINKYCDNVPYTDKDIDYNELAKLAKDININYQPIKSGTIGIIFLGMYQDQKVIIKTQRKNIKKKLISSLELFDFIGYISDYIPILNTFNIKNILKKNASNLLDQINYKQELDNLNVFGNYFAKFENIIIPKVYKQLSCNSIIVMEYLEGINLNKLLKNDNLINKQALNFCEFFNESLYNLNIIHSDLHPGNVIFIKDKIGIIDFGLIKKIEKKHTLFMYHFFNGLQSKNIQKFWIIIKDKLAVKINKYNPLGNTPCKNTIIILKSFMSDELPSVNDFLKINKYLYFNNLRLRDEFINLIINMSPQIDLLKSLVDHNKSILRTSFLKLKNKLIVNKLN